MSVIRVTIKKGMLSEKMSIRLGALVFGGVSFLATLPLAFVAGFIVNSVHWGNIGHCIVIGGTWLAFAFSILSVILCFTTPTIKTYALNICSFAVTGVVWFLWFTPLTRNLLH
ncbi:MAG: hypothetical protein ACFCU3_03920 [Verrucomicrobiales bacterium]